MNKRIARLIQLGAAVATVFALAGCSPYAINNADPEAAEHPGGKTAEDAIESYFAALESGDAAALAELAVEEVDIDSIHMPDTPPTLKTVYGAPEQNPRPVDRKFVTVQIVYRIDSETATWDASMRYAGEEKGWQFFDPFVSIVTSEDSQQGLDADGKIMPGEHFAPGIHELGDELSTKYLKAPERGIDVRLAHAVNNEAKKNGERIQKAVDLAQFTLTDEAKAAAKSKIEEFRDDCKDWCSHFDRTIQPHKQLPDAEGRVLRFKADATMPDKVTLIDSHSKDEKAWYEEQHSHVDPLKSFVKIEPVTIERTKYTCKNNDCTYASAAPDYKVVKKAAFIYEIKGDELEFVEIRDNE